MELFVILKINSDSTYESYCIGVFKTLNDAINHILYKEIKPRIEEYYDNSYDLNKYKKDLETHMECELLDYYRIEKKLLS